MSVHSISTGLPVPYGLPPPYAPLAGTHPPSGKSAAAGKESAEKPLTTAASVPVAGSAVTRPEPDDARQNASTATSDGATEAGQIQSNLELELQQARATAASSGSAASEPAGTRAVPGIALYQRVSQYGNNEPSTSALLKSWNDIVHGGQVAESAVAGFARTLSQNPSLGLKSGVLDLTA
jgi:hypothetical protein